MSKKQSVSKAKSANPVLFPGFRMAEFSACRKYRYRLGIVWDVGAAMVNFLLLNPSTAGERKNVERLQRRALRMGFGGLVVSNLFALRSTDPLVLREADDPVGPDNDRAIVTCAEESDLVIVGWGEHGVLHGRDALVRELLDQVGKPVYALGVNQSRQPIHPLDVPYRQAPLPFELFRGDA